MCVLTNGWWKKSSMNNYSNLFISYLLLPCGPQSIQSSWNFNPNVINSINPLRGIYGSIPLSHVHIDRYRIQKPVRCMISNVREDNGRASKPIIIIFQFVNNNCRVSVTTTGVKSTYYTQERRIMIIQWHWTRKRKYIESWIKVSIEHDSD